MVILLVGNKLDLAHAHRRVDAARAREYIRSITGDATALLEVSCRDDDGVRDVFYELASRLIRRQEDVLRTARQASSSSGDGSEERQDRSGGAIRLSGSNERSTSESSVSCC
ncbi:hypothetical protein GGI12_001976 [Dipsacomyces acuminosporus]|nr:hypothetical protein GGI12_001976 [Dipsacomyces acuminosporus]